MEREGSRPDDVRLCKKLELKAPVGQPAGNSCTCSRVVLTLEIRSYEILTLEIWNNGTCATPPNSPGLKAAEEVQWPRHST